MTSGENVEIWRGNIERQLAELTAGTNPEAGIAGMAEIWDPEAELDATDVPVLDLGGIYRGADAVRKFWQEWFSWETLEFDYELIDAGERVIMLVDLRMRGRSTGIEMPFGNFALGQHVPGRIDRPREVLQEPVGDPRSRRAAGVALRTTRSGPTVSPRSRNARNGAVSVVPEAMRERCMSTES